MNVLGLPFWPLVKERVGRSWLAAVLVLGGAVAFLAAAYVFQIVAHVPPGNLSRDTNGVAKLPFYTGFISNLGWTLWAGAAACAFMGANLLRRSNRRKAWFLLLSGAMTTWLALDDMLQFHELVFPYRLHIPQPLVFGTYLTLAAAFFLYFLRDILSDTDFPILFAALFFMASSILIDQFTNIVNDYTSYVFLEDAAKFVGVVLWLTYYALTVTRMLKERMLPAS